MQQVFVTVYKVRNLEGTRIFKYFVLVWPSRGMSMS